MSTLLHRTSAAEGLVACRTCLSMERKLYSLYDKELSESYKFLIGIEVSPFDGLPQYICNYCAILLLKFNTFRRNSQQAKSYLEEAKIIPEIFSTHPISLHKSEIKIIDTTCNDPDIKTNTNYDLNTDNLVYKNDVSLDYTNDHSDQDMESIDNLNILKIEPQESDELAFEYPKISKKGKYFESDENLKDFERSFNMEVIILSPEQQMRDVFERKLSSNYLHSPYKCELCYKGVMDEESLKKHVLYQHDPSRGSIVCDYCKFRYKDNRGLNQHLKSHRLKFACKQCSYVCRTTFNAKEHFKMHTGYMHECRHCGKSYEKLSSHLTHLRIHHPSHFIWCDVCGEAFIGKFGLNAHKKRAHRHLCLPFECITCKARFTTEAALIRHTSYNNCPSFKCVHCGESFDKDMNLREHLLEKHRSLKVYECEKCNKTFSKQSLHSAHYRRAHIDSKDKVKTQKPWVCEVCGKTLPNRCLLLYHQRNHTGEKPYQCPQCSKSFTMRKLLQSHLRVHTSERPYACKSCPKTFKGLSALRAHEHVHTGGQKKTSKNRKL